MDIKETPIEDVLLMRQQVMYPQEPLDFVKLEDDCDGRHLGVYEDGELVSVISLFKRDEVIQFRKFATRNDKQGLGYGSALLQYVINEAASGGYSAIWCNARLSATAIYKRFGFSHVGNGWQKWGIDFVKMEKQLKG